MSINPLAQVKNYSSMLNRIFLCTAISASVATAILRAHWKWLDELLKPLDIPIELIGLKDQKWFGYIVPGVAFAFIARTIRLHDRLSDLLWIRAIFDVHHILLPLAQESGFPVGKLKMKTLYAQRNALMGDAFYKFVSSTNPKIDKHLIYEALDWWSWYQVIVESVFVFVVTAIALFFLDGFWLAVTILGVCMGLVVLVLPFFWFHCIRRAKSEVHAILDNANRKARVNDAFRALPS